MNGRALTDSPETGKMTFTESGRGSMPSDKMKRICLDAAMAISFLILISLRFLPKIFHELLGIVMLALTIWHLFLNRAWFSSLVKGAWSRRRFFPAATNVLLLLVMMATFVTGLCVSNAILHGWFEQNVAKSLLIHRLHDSLPYYALILAGLHLGFHWRGIWTRFIHFRSLDIESRRYKIFCSGAVMLLLFAGIFNSFAIHLGDHLMLKHMFGIFKRDVPMIVPLLQTASVFGLYTLIGSEAANRL